MAPLPWAALRELENLTFQTFGGNTMNEEQQKFYLYIDGQAVPVSEQVYRAYHHYARKEEYFTYDLKAEKFFFFF